MFNDQPSAPKKNFTRSRRMADSTPSPIIRDSGRVSVRGNYTADAGHGEVLNSLIKDVSATPAYDFSNAIMTESGFFEAFNLGADGFGVSVRLLTPDVPNGFVVDRYGKRTVRINLSDADIANLNSISDELRKWYPNAIVRDVVVENKTVYPKVYEKIKTIACVVGNNLPEFIDINDINKKFKDHKLQTATVQVKTWARETREGIEIGFSTSPVMFYFD